MEQLDITDTTQEESRMMPLGEMAALNDRNDQTSLFHRLPAELREMIYQWAFPSPGLHLHIWRRPGTLKEPFCTSTRTIFRAYPEGKEIFPLNLRTAHHKILYTHTECLVPHGDDYNYSSTKLSDDEAIGRPVWNWLERERHGRCFDRAFRRKFPIGLLGSCRLIYSETAHLLYHGHVFYFHDAADLNDFSLALGARQRRAVKHVRLYCDIVRAGSPLCQFTQEAANSLESLESLRVTIGAAMRPWLQRTPKFGLQLRDVAVVIGPPYQKHLAGHSAHRNRPNAEEIENWILSHRRERKSTDESDEENVDTGPVGWMAYEANPPLWHVDRTDS